MFGGGIGWFYRDLAGLRPKEGGFRTFDIHPVVPQGLDWIEYSHETLYGDICIKWEHKDGKFVLDCTVPVGTSATVWLPSDKGRKAYEIGSGSYKFISELK
jgi:alpha-L-rhamnosidase